MKLTVGKELSYGDLSGNERVAYTAANGVLFLASEATIKLEFALHFWVDAE